MNFQEVETSNSRITFNFSLNLCVFPMRSTAEEHKYKALEHGVFTLAVQDRMNGREECRHIIPDRQNKVILSRTIFSLC